jgi:hypothetical protein
VKRLADDRKLNHIWARIVATNVERPASTSCYFRVYLGVENALLPRQRSGRNRSPRLDHDGIAIVDPLVRLEQPVAIGKIFGQRNNV